MKRYVAIIQGVALGISLGCLFMLFMNFIVFADVETSVTSLGDKFDVIEGYYDECIESEVVFEEAQLICTPTHCYGTIAKNRTYCRKTQLVKDI